MPAYPENAGGPALSRDLELRPRDAAAPASLHRLLGPHIAEYVADLGDNLQGIKGLIREARAARNVVVEATLRVKLAELLLKTAQLAQGAAETLGARGSIRSQEDLPSLEALPADVRAKLDEAFGYAEERLGPGWMWELREQR